MSDDLCKIIGVMADGTEHLLGEGPIPWRMKAKDILRSYGFDDLDSEASPSSYALVAVEDLVGWMLKVGWTAPPMITHPAPAGTPYPSSMQDGVASPPIGTEESDPKGV